jgi:hypothetical protein
MTQPCPPELTLVRFVDRDLSPEDHQFINMHVLRCTRCAQEVKALDSLIAVLGVAPESTVDLDQHAAAVMGRIRSQVAEGGATLEATPRRSVARRSVAWLSVLSTAAAGIALAWVVGRAPELDRLQARGELGTHSLSRDVGVQLYVEAEGLRGLAPGDHVDRDAHFTVGLRNLGQSPAYLCLLLIDAAHTLHWVTPEYRSLNEDPESTLLPPATVERPLATSVEFDDLATGPLRVLAIITPRPLHVSALDQLTADELATRALTQRFPDAEVRELLLQVTP